MDITLSANRKQQHRYLFVGIVLVFLALRLLILLTNIGNVYFGEETFRGTIAREILRGLKFSFLDYQSDSYSGGSLVVGVLTVPFFRLFGPSLFSLQLTALSFSLATLTLSFFFLRRFFGDRAAIAGMFLLTFAPPALTQLSLVTMGFHSESLLFTTAILFFFYQALWGEGKRGLAFFLFGLMTGLGFSFTYITILTFLSCLPSLISGRKAFSFKESVPPFLLGAFLGLVPWGIYNAGHHFAGLHFLSDSLHSQLFDSEINATLVKKIKHLCLEPLELVLEGIPMSFCFPGFRFIPGALLSYLYAGGILALIAASWNSLKANAKLLPLISYPFIFILAYTVNVSDVEVKNFTDARYFIPLQFILILLTAVLLAQRTKYIRWLVFFLLFGLWGQSQLVFREPFGRALHYSGYSMSWLGMRWGELIQSKKMNLNDFYAEVETLGEDERRLVYMGLIGSVLDPGMASALDTSFEKIDGEMKKWPEEYRFYVYDAMPLHLDCSSSGRIQSLADKIENAHGKKAADHFRAAVYASPNCLASALEASARPAPGSQAYFYLILGQDYYWRFTADPGSAHWNLAGKYFSEALPESLRSFYEGLGRSAADHSVETGNDFDKALKDLPVAVPAQYQRDFYRGVGWELRNNTMEDPVWAGDRINRLPSEYRGYALEGVRAWREWYGFQS